MTNKMPCHITDGPQTPEDVHHTPVERDPDEAHEEEMQRRLDNALCRWCGEHYVPDWGEMCHECQTTRGELIFDAMMDR